MEQIWDLMDQIDDELEDARRYAGCAMQERETAPDLAKLHRQLSEEEMAHVQNLHVAAVKLIDGYKKEHGEPPAPMMQVYKRMHEKHLKKAADVRALIEMSKQQQ